MAKQLISTLELSFSLFVLKKLLSKSDKQNSNSIGQMTNLISEQRPWFKKVYQIHNRNLLVLKRSMAVVDGGFKEGLVAVKNPHLALANYRFCYSQ